MPLEFALVNPVDVQLIESPTTYVEAREILYSTGAILEEIIAGQDLQKNVSQIVTAQTSKDLGLGWQRVFIEAADDPASPGQDDVQFQWSPMGGLTIAFPSDFSDSLCKGLDHLARSANWHYVFDSIDSWESLQEIQGFYSAERQTMLENESIDILDARIKDAVHHVFGEIFALQGSEAPLFTEVEFHWGGASACLGELYRSSY